MNLENAIEILYRWRNGDTTIYDDILKQAFDLGIEALKQIKESRFDPSTWEPQTLPGETKE